MKSDLPYSLIFFENLDLWIPSDNGMVEKYPNDSFESLSQLATRLDGLCAPEPDEICGAGLLPVGAAASADTISRCVIGSCSPLNDCPASASAVFSFKLN